MKKLVIVAFVALASQAASAATIESFCPQSWNDVGFDGNGILKVWGVPELPDGPLMAVPNDSWPRFTAVAAWRDSFKDAKKNGTCVKVSYDPNLFHDDTSGIDGHRIWEVTD